MAILFLVTATAFGAALALELRARLHVGEIAGLAVGAGLLLSTWLLWICVVLVGYRAGTWLCLAIQTGLAALLLVRRFAGRRAGAPADDVPHPPPCSPVGWALLTVASLVVLWPLFSSHMFAPRAGGWYSGGWTAVDLLHHMAFAARFSAQSAFTFDSPLAAGEPLTYPFLIDFLSGGLMRMGMGARMSFLLPTLLLSLASVQLLFFLGLRLFARMRAAAAAVAIFFFNGSAVGLYYFWQDWQESGKGLFGFLAGMRRQYAQLGDKGIHLGNFVCNELLPQRGVPLGLAAFLAILLLLRLGSEASGRRRAAILAGAGVLAGSLPFAHVHTFIVAIAVLGWFAAAQTIEVRSVRHPWAAALAIALAVALPQLAWQMGGVEGGFLRFHAGWMSKPNENVVVHWTNNLGLGALFLVAGLWLAWRLGSPFHRRLYIPLFLLFVLCNLVALQPAVYDNSKVFYYSYLGVSLYAGYALGELGARGWIGLACAALLFAAMTAVGGLSILRESRASAIVYRDSELRLATELARALPADARILAHERNPVPFIAGRAMALGLRQTLVNHGVRFAELERDIGAMFAARSDSIRLYCKHRITHALIGPAERRRWKPAVIPAWMRRIDLAEPGIELYEIDPAACPDRR